MHIDFVIIFVMIGVGAALLFFTTFVFLKKTQGAQFAELPAHIQEIFLPIIARLKRRSALTAQIQQGFDGSAPNQEQTGHLPHTDLLPSRC